MEQACEALNNEIDIVGMLRSKRYVHLALKYLIKAPIRKQLKL